MSFHLVSILGDDLHHHSFVPRWQCDIDRENERKFISDAANLAHKGHAKIHALQIDGADYGFMALRVHHFKNKHQRISNVRSYLQLQLLFVSKRYRKERLEELEGLTAAEYLMYTAIGQSQAASTYYPFDSLVLHPAHENLVRYYRRYKFELIDKANGFMYLPLKQADNVI